MATTNYIDGVTNAAMDSTLYSLTRPDPTTAYEWWDEFMNYTAADWTITETGTGTRAVAAGGAGGVLVITNGAVDDDFNSLQYSGNTSAATVETFKFVSGKRSWGKVRFKVSDATQSDVMIGLVITDTTPIAGVTDGVYFLKSDGSTTLSLVQTLNSTSTTTTAGTMVSDTYVTAGYHYDGGSVMSVFFNDTLVSNAVTTNLVTDEELAVTLVVQNGEAVAKILSVDYAGFWQER